MSDERAQGNWWEIDGRFHVLGGVTRSGSTMLCNILAQNPLFHVTDSTNIGAVIRAMVATWSILPETKSDLIRDREGKLESLRMALLGAIRGMFEEQFAASKVVIVKDRNWATQSWLLRHILPSAKLIITVRDLRDVFASYERQQRRRPILSPLPGGPSSMTAARMQTVLGPQGVIGSSVESAFDLHLQQPKNLVVMKYEELVEKPDEKLYGLYKELKLDNFEHDLDNVQPHVNDVDELYNLHWPHEGKGKVTDAKVGSWKDIVNPGVAQRIITQWSAYQAAFGYEFGQQRG